uniref:26S proteasome non-ATPase regulatory subunit 5 n=1 Tax=Dromaius novaehollandiae TaxID=8790 RepID=A0A8C4J4P3_DRONO
CLETLSQHLECLRLCGGDMDAEEQILESLNEILLSLAEDILFHGYQLFILQLQLFDFNMAKTQQFLSFIYAEEMKKPCIEADLILTLIPLLESTDQEMLLHAGRAIGRICYDNRKYLVEGILFFLAVRHNYERLHRLFKHFDALKVQLVEAGVQEVLSEILLRLQGSSQAEDTCVVKAASDLIVSLLLGGKRGILTVQIHQELIVGVIHQLLDLLEKHVESGDVSVQHAALSALRNLAIPVVNKVQMLEEGVAERIQALLRSEMPPVQFKLLGTLRMLADGQADAAEILGQDPMLLNRLVQWCDANDHTGVRGEANRLLASILRHNRSQEVVKAIQEAQGVKHLVSMTTSEHVTMQNEALNALAIASAINLGIFLLKESQLVQSLHKLLQDENTSPEVKYNSMGLLCSLLNSETLEQLCSHSNANVAKEAVATLQILRGEPPH